MKQLTDYKKHGSHYSLVIRQNGYAIARGVNSFDHVTYEVFEVQSHNGREIHGKQIEASEYAPGDAQWGTKGWTFKTRQGAVYKMLALIMEKNKEAAK